MNRLVRPVMFAFEPDVVLQFTRVTFGTAGAATLDTKNSKGACGFSLNMISFTATTTASVNVTAVSSFAGLYVGMTVTGTNIPASTTISSMNPAAGTMVLSQAATGANAGLSASGGQYTLTFGTQLTPFARLDTYVKLLDIDATFEAASLGGATTGASSPTAPSFFVVQNNVSNSSLANIVIQFGTFSGSTFTAANPASGEKLELSVCLCRSTAI